VPLPRFGDLLRKHRQSAGFSQELFAERAGMSVDAVSALERGVRRAPHASTLDLLLAALDLPAAEALELKEAAARARARGAEPVAQPPSAGNLSYSVTSFIGRQAEVAELRKLVADEGCRLVTISGPGGVGKSRLALEVVQQLTEAGGWIVSLANLSEPERVAEMIAETLRVTIGPDEPAITALQRGLRQSDSIIIIDNCEHLIDAVAAVVSAIITACPRVRVVATSRERLRIHGEVVFALSPLLCPAAQITTASDAAAYPAIELFVRRGTPFAAELAALSDADAAAAVDIVRQLDGLPLAIELTVPMLRLFGIGTLATRLRERLRVPLPGNRDAPERHQTIDGIVDWSYQRLSALERTVFEACSVFAGTFTLEALLDVCAADAISDDDVIAAFAALVDKSLVTFADASRTRYLILETIRAYASSAARRSENLDALRGRFALHYVALAEGFEPPITTVDQLRKVTRLKADRHNIEAALTWALVDENDPVIGARLVLGSAELLAGEAFSTSRHWFEHARRLLDAENHSLLWSEITCRAQGYLQLSPDSIEHLPDLERAVAIIRSRDKPRLLANSLVWLAAGYQNAGDQERCDRAVAEAVAIARQQETRFLAYILHYAAYRTTDAVCRRAQIEEALSIYDGDESNLVRAAWYANLADAQYLTGDINVALATARRAVEFAEHDNSDYFCMAVLRLFAALALLSGDLLSGFDAARRAVSLAAGLDDSVHLAIALQAFAYALALSGDLERAALLIGFADRRTEKIKRIETANSSRECRTRLASLLTADDFRALEQRGADWTGAQVVEAAFATSPM
jgi:predicted ATPase/DNA-binding XRE family transcriptional regulator